MRLTVASDASGTGWGGCIVSPAPQVHISIIGPHKNNPGIFLSRKLWPGRLKRVLLAVQRRVVNARVDAFVDNIWSLFKHGPVKGGGRGVAFFLIGFLIKSLFFTTVQLNTSLLLIYILTEANPADLPSRRLFLGDSKLHPDIWYVVQIIFHLKFGKTLDYHRVSNM